MKKRILLIDPSLNVFRSLQEVNDIEVVCLVAGTIEQSQDVKRDFTNIKVFDFESIYSHAIESSSDFNYSVFSKFSGAQVKFSNYMSRVSNNKTIIDLVYHSTLFFWVDFFNKEKIDIVISNMLEWGGVDSIIFDVAKERGIESYLFETGLTNGANILSGSVLRYSDKQYLVLNLLELGLNKVDIDECSNYSLGIGKKTKKRMGFKSYLLEYGGYTSFYLVYRLFKRKSFFSFNIFRIDLIVLFFNLIYSYFLVLFYKRISSDCFGIHKYIFYALHMEPEAATLNRTYFSNQLVIIKALANALPIGCKLLVKEHPHQYRKLNSSDRYYFLLSLYKFRNFDFYNKIKKIPNVELVSLNVHSSALIDDALAVCTINGTIGIEAINKNKPLILFSQNTTPLKHVKGVCDVSSFSELSDCIKNFEATNWFCSYNDFLSTVESRYFKVNLSDPPDYAPLIRFLINGCLKC